MRFFYTAEMLEFLRREYRQLRVPELTSAFNAHFGLAQSQVSIKSALSNHGITCPRSGRFEPGAVSWNKGTHFTAGGRSAETRFKPGDRPQTWVPIGTEVRDPDGYLKRKIRDDATPGMSRRNWKFVHVLLWEEHHGPVPSGHAVIFRNGDKSDLRLENLELISRQELLYRNRHGLTHLEDPAVQDATSALAKLEVRRYALEKRRAGNG